MWKYTSQCVNHVKAAVPSLLQNTTQCFVEQTRNTFIFRRKYKVPILRKDEHFRKLGARYFIYELVENRNVIKPKPIDIILTKDVSSVGRAGDKVTLHPMIAYNNFLLPQLAVYASPENIEKFCVSNEQEKHVYSSPYVQKTIDFLSLANVPVEMSDSESWTIEKWHIRVAFRKIKFMVPESAITLPLKPIEGPNPDLENKQFYVTITINNKEQVKVRCTIKHWKDVCVKYDRHFFCQKGTAVFPEDQAILDEMPVRVFGKNTNVA